MQLFSTPNWIVILCKTENLIQYCICTSKVFVDSEETHSVLSIRTRRKHEHMFEGYIWA